MKNLEGLEGKNVTLKQREDNNKMSYGRKVPGTVLADSKIEEYDV